MVAVKAHQAEAFLRSLERVPPAVLFYGTDAGLVSERAAMLARRLAERDGSEVLRIDDADLENEPARISIELQTVAMFGGRKVVRALAGRRVNANALKPLVEGGNIEGFLIVEAGNLRPDEALRALFEKSAGAAAVACFPDEARDLDAMVGEILRAAGLQIAPDAKRFLLTRLGADRALSRAEVEKLALFARGKTLIEEADVEAAVGDAAELALDRIVLAAGSGRSAEAVTECDRSRRRRRERAGRDRRAATPFPAAASAAQRPRCRAFARRRDAVLAAAAALQAEGRARAAMPRLDPCQAQCGPGENR